MAIYFTADQLKRLRADIKLPETPKRNKYGAIKRTVDGKTFDSTSESERYQILKLLQKHGKVSNLMTQVSFPLKVNGQRVGKYIADFVYIDLEKNEIIVEDTKGMKTAVYNLKKKLVKAIYNIEIFETQ